RREVPARADCREWTAERIPTIGEDPQAARRVPADAEMLDDLVAGDCARGGYIAVALLVPGAYGEDRTPAGDRPARPGAGTDGTRAPPRQQSPHEVGGLLAEEDVELIAACRRVEPRGGMARSPRTMTLTTASRGSPSS